MSLQTIGAEVDEFTPGFSGQIGQQNADAFAAEQADLNAAGVPGGAVKAGDTVPDASLLTRAGDGTTVSAVLDGKPAVVVFYRGAWCPFCSIALRSYQRNLLPELERRGVPLIAISPQTPEGTERAVTEWGLRFTVLSDPGNALAAALDIVTAPSPEAQDAQSRLGFDVADSNADSTRAIPYPTVLVVDGQRVVRYADVHVDYTTRTEVGTILEAVDRL